MLLFIRLWFEDECSCILLVICCQEIYHIRRILDFGLTLHLTYGLCPPFFRVHPQKFTIDVSHPILCILDQILIASEDTMFELYLLRDSLLVTGIALIPDSIGVVSIEIVLLLIVEELLALLIFDFALVVLLELLSEVG